MGELAMELKAEVASVLIVGAGPTGLALALALAAWGVRARVVEAAEAPAVGSRAVGLHARTLEVLDDLGVGAEVIALGRRCFGASFWVGERRLAHVDFDELDSPHPFMVTLAQRELERVMTARLAALGVEVERGLRLVDLVQREGEPVSVVLESAEARVEVEAEWVVGCDGAGSRVRNALGLAFEGERLTDDVVLLDVDGESGLPADEMHTLLGEDGFVVVLPMPGDKLRLVVSVAHEDGIGHVPTFEELGPILARRAPSVVVEGAPSWIARYAVSGRVAERFSVGRVFLAGDAAHVFSPFGSQGLNVGVHDAHNLGWKLGMVVQGHAWRKLLDSYGAERRPIAEAVMEMADRAARVVTLRGAASRAVRDRLGPLLAGLDAVHARVVAGFAGVRLDYAGSPVCGEHRVGVLEAKLLRDPSSEQPSLLDWVDFGRGPGAGARVPDGECVAHPSGTAVRLAELVRQARFTLLLFDGSAATAEGYVHLTRLGHAVLRTYGAWVRVVLVVPRDPPPEALVWEGELVLDARGDLHRRFGAGSECLYLVRPDGYVGFRAQPADGVALLTWLEEQLIVETRS